MRARGTATAHNTKNSLRSKNKLRDLSLRRAEFLTIHVWGVQISIQLKIKYIPKIYYMIWGLFSSFLFTHRFSKCCKILVYIIKREENCYQTRKRLCKILLWRFAGKSNNVLCRTVSQTVRYVGLMWRTCQKRCSDSGVWDPGLLVISNEFLCDVDASGPRTTL